MGMLLFASLVEGGYRLTIDLLAPTSWRPANGIGSAEVESDRWQTALRRWMQQRAHRGDGQGLI
jgi:hypothetical protein